MPTRKTPRQIVITGPESTGKSTLTQALARHYRAAAAPEFARSYLRGLGRPYQETDLLIIAEGQYLWERYAAYRAADAGLFFCDTSLEVIKIWADYRYGRAHPWIRERLSQSTADLYLLCVPDIPWTYDPLRENPHDREALLAIYERELAILGAPFHLISGPDPAERLARAIEVIVDIK